MRSSPNKYIAMPRAFDNKVRKLPALEVYYVSSLTEARFRAWYLKP